MARVLKTLVVILGIGALTVGGIAAVVILGVRTRNRRFLEAFTRFQRDVLNPEVLRTAGGAGEQYQVIEHVGRASGTAYRTPVGARRDGDGWSVVLVYGRDTSWVRNLLAAGSGVLHAEGERRRVDRFEIVPVDEVAQPAGEARATRLFGVTEALRMRDAGPAQADEAATHPAETIGPA